MDHNDPRGGGGNPKILIEIWGTFFKITEGTIKITGFTSAQADLNSG